MGWEEKRYVRSSIFSDDGLDTKGGMEEGRPSSLCEYMKGNFQRMEPVAGKVN